jgi:hypothetical protein
LGIRALMERDESISDAVVRYRAQLLQLNSERDGIRRATYPSRDVKAAMREQVHQLAEAAAPRVDGAIKRGSPVVFPTTTTQSLVRNADKGAIVFNETADALGLFAWMFGDQLISRLESEIDKAADDKHALSRDERERQEAALMGYMLAVERKEVALIFAAEARGELIDFRADTSVEAALGVRLVTRR